MNNQLKNQFVFVLGREQEIALAELKAVLARFNFPCLPAGRVLTPNTYKITANLVFANIDNFTTNDAIEIMDSLAGTIKIYKTEDFIKKDIAGQIVDIFRSHKANGEGKINFAVSYFGKGFSKQHINTIALRAKKQLKNDFSLRYVEPKDSLELNSILSLKNNLLGKGIEFGLFDGEIGTLIALNDPEEWSKRDYGKPAGDKYSGMLPPKLARMMINLAIGEVSKSKIQISNKNQSDQIPKSEIGNDGSEISQNEVLVVDPFCGSGNVLAESMMLGFDVIGSDISEKAVSDSKKNLEWLMKEISKSKLQMTNKDQSVKNPKYKVFQADATSDSLIGNLKLEITNYDRVAIVSEPYLGRPKKYKPTYNIATGEYLKIKDLYINFLKNIHALSTINNKPILCLVFPLVETSDKGKFSLFSQCVDEIKEMGYTQIRPTLVYGRDYQVIKREIVLLRLG